MKLLHQMEIYSATIVLTASVCVAPAVATPGNGFSLTPVVNGHFGTLNVNTAGDKTDKWGLHLKTLDDADMSTDRLTVQPGGVSGWHAHPAPVFVTVTQGTIEWYDDALCTAHTYTAGQSFIEPAYRAHDVRNTGAQVAEFVGMVIKPIGYAGFAFRLDRPEPNNCK